jgi:hypothetical protein
LLLYSKVVAVAVAVLVLAIAAVADEVLAASH